MIECKTCGREIPDAGDDLCEDCRREVDRQVAAMKRAVRAAEGLKCAECGGDLGSDYRVDPYAPKVPDDDRPLCPDCIARILNERLRTDPRFRDAVHKGILARLRILYANPEAN